MKGIADTGLLVAFANGRDRHHAWAVSVVGEISEPLLTCEPVLAETAFHLGDAGVVLDMVLEGLVKVSFVVGQHLPELQALARRYADRRPDLADLCLVRMSELHRGHTVVTVDRADFVVYRRNRREVIPILCPPR